MLRLFILLLYAYVTVSIGFDSGGGDRTTCGRPFRSGRIYQPPCDLGHLGYCTQAGQLYPWKAVKRFVRDNQGLMRRMYGDQRHGHVLRTELDDDVNVMEDVEDFYHSKDLYGDWRPHHLRFSKYQHLDDLDNNNVDINIDKRMKNPYNTGESRYLKEDLLNEDVLNTKFVVSKQDAAVAIKLAELKAAVHFKLANQRPTYVSHKSTYATSTTVKPSTSNTSFKSTQSTITTTTTTDKSTIKNANQNNKKTAKPWETNNEQTTIDEWQNTELTTDSYKNIKTSTTSAPSSTTVLSTTDEASELLTTDTTDQTTENKMVTATTTTTTATNTIPVDVSTFNSNKTTNSTTDNIHIATDRISEIVDSDSSNHISETVNGDDNISGANNQMIENKIDVNVDLTNNNNNNNNKQKNNGSTSGMLYPDSNKKNFIIDYSKMKGVNACPVKEEVVAPFWANNTRGEVLALLNMYPFEQYVHWEKCTFEHRQMYCRDGCRCEQQYRLHRLLAYDPNNECRGIFSDWFRFPSCCICKCYDIPMEFRVTSRSPRFHFSYNDNDNEAENDNDEEYRN